MRVLVLSPVIVYFISAIFALPTSDIGTSRQLDAVLRVYNGDEVSIEQCPYYVNLPGGCGGSVIDKRWILTAAHCLNESVVHVACDIASCRTHGQSHKVKRQIRHPLYNAATLYHDIALIELAVPLKLSSKVQPIKLAKEENYMEEDLATVVGMGSYAMPYQPYSGEYPNYYISDHLRTGSVKILFRESCIKLYKALDKNAGEKERLAEDVICAYPASGNKRQEACFGDSGGPLVSGDRQVGLVSYGITAWCSPVLPGVYTKVAYFSDWIHNYTGL